MLLIANRLAGCSRKAREYWGRDTLPILGAVLTFSCALLLLFYAPSANAAERQLLGGHVPRAVANLHLQP